MRTQMTPKKRMTALLTRLVPFKLMKVKKETQKEKDR